MPQTPARRSFPVIPVVIGLAVVLGIVAVVATRGSDSDSDKGSSVAGVEEIRAVTVAGSPLPDYAAGQDPDPAVGRSIPTVQGAAFDGSPVNITGNGKGKVIVFLAHWCPHCQREVPLITQYLASHQPPANVELLGVSTGVDQPRGNFPPSEWLARERWPVRTLADDSRSTAAAAFGLTGYPYFVAADGSGKVVGRASGEITMDEFAALMQKAAAATT